MVLACHGMLTFSDFVAHEIKKIFVAKLEFLGRTRCPSGLRLIYTSLLLFATANNHALASASLAVHLHISIFVALSLQGGPQRITNTRLCNWYHTNNTPCLHASNARTSQLLHYSTLNKPPTAFIFADLPCLDCATQPRRRCHHRLPPFKYGTSLHRCFFKSWTRASSPPGW